MILPLALGLGALGALYLYEKNKGKAAPAPAPVGPTVLPAAPPQDAVQLPAGIAVTWELPAGQAPAAGAKVTTEVSWATGTSGTSGTLLYLAPDGINAVVQIDGFPTIPGFTLYMPKVWAKKALAPGSVSGLSPMRRYQVRQARLRRL